MAATRPKAVCTPTALFRTPVGNSFMNYAPGHIVISLRTNSETSAAVARTQHTGFPFLSSPTKSVCWMKVTTHQRGCARGKLTECPIQGPPSVSEHLLDKIPSCFVEPM